MDVNLDDFLNDEEFFDEGFLEHQLEDCNIFSETDYFESDEVSIPPVPAEDVGGPEIPHLATLYTAERLDEAIWAALLDALVDRMLVRLPPAAFARFRSVCKRWNELPSSPGWLRQYAEVARRPSCTIMCRLRLDPGLGSSYFDSPLPRVPARNEFFFCHSEQKWFAMPPLSIFQEEGAPNWELVDVNWGLVCYACYKDSGLSLCVTNPLTKAATVLPPPFLGGSLPEGTPSNYKFAKLVVERQSKTYKIVVLLRSSRPPSTMVYDSASALWTVLQSYPPLDPYYDRAGDSFLWKRTVFMPCNHQGVLLAFDVDSGAWRDVKIESTAGGEMHYLFEIIFPRYLLASSFDKFMIIRSCLTPFRLAPSRVLTLKDHAASPFPLFEDNKWVEVDVRNRVYLQKVTSLARCSASHNGCLIFTNPIKNQWVTYTISTRTWREMPSPSAKDVEYPGQDEWHNWEPRWDMRTGPDPLPVPKMGV